MHSLAPIAIVATVMMIMMMMMMMKLTILAKLKTGQKFKNRWLHRKVTDAL
jgi:hypothetical protein